MARIGQQGDGVGEPAHAEFEDHIGEIESDAKVETALQLGMLQPMMVMMMVVVIDIMLVRVIVVVSVSVGLVLDMMIVGLCIRARLSR